MKKKATVGVPKKSKNKNEEKKAMIKKDKKAMTIVDKELLVHYFWKMSRPIKVGLGSKVDLNDLSHVYLGDLTRLP